MNNDIKTWFLLNPDDFESMWWRTTNIIDIDKSKIYKSIQESLAFIIIQDGNMGGNFWHFSTWYNDDPNRYSSMIFSNNWPFNKQLTEMNPGEIIHLTNFPDKKFMVYPCKFGSPAQSKYCKILERIPS